MPTYRWTGAHAYRDHANGRTIDPGEELPADAADRIADAHPHDVEAVEEAEEEEADEPDGPEEDDEAALPPFETSELTVSELESGLENVDDVEVLEAIRESEVEGKDRDTAIDAIDARIDAVSE